MLVVEGCVCVAKFTGARRRVPPPDCVTVDGQFTAPSNAAFDESLKARNAAWGIRDIGACEAVAEAAGLTLLERVPMPANNFLLVWEKVIAKL